MWPFKRKTKADAALAVMDQAIAFTADKWSYFTKALPFKEDVPLKDRITAFLVPATEGLKNNFPALRSAPDAISSRRES